jgi:transcription elongation factor GreA
MADEIILTPGGKKKAEEELEHLRGVEMPALSDRIREARELGDLSENFDYQDSKRQQGFVAGRIQELQAMLDRAIIVEDVAPENGIAGMGSVITVRDLDEDDEYSYTLVGTYEADPLKDKISINSPIGHALTGQKVGAIVEVETPGGKNRLEIIAIS